MMTHRMLSILKEMLFLCFELSRGVFEFLVPIWQPPRFKSAAGTCKDLKDCRVFLCVPPDSYGSANSRRQSRILFTCTWWALLKKSYCGSSSSSSSLLETTGWPWLVQRCVLNLHLFFFLKKKHSNASCLFWLLAFLLLKSTEMQFVRSSVGSLASQNLMFERHGVFFLYLFMCTGDGEDERCGISQRSRV